MTTYYVDGAVGDDSNAGTDEGAGNAWATIGKAASTATAALDQIYVKNSVTYNETVDWGTGGLVRSIIGYSSTPGDDGVVTVDVEDGSGVCFEGGVRCTFANFHFTNAISSAFDSNNAGDITFVNCRFSNSPYGIVAGTSSLIVLHACVFDNNSTAGFYQTNGNAVIKDCYFESNGYPIQVLVSDVTTIVNCVFYNNTSPIRVYHPVVMNCTSYQNGGDNVEVLNTSGVVVESILVNGVYGIDGISSNVQVSSAYNVYFDELTLSDVSQASSDGSKTAENKLVTADPLLTDTGSGDLSLQAESPCLSLGMSVRGILAKSGFNSSLGSVPIGANLQAATGGVVGQAINGGLIG